MPAPIEPGPFALDDGPMKDARTERWLIAGVDDSPHAAAVAHVALVLGRRLSLKVMLVHAVGGPAARTTLVGERRLDALDAGQSVLDAVTRRVGHDEELTVRLVFGGAAEQITELREQLDAELIVTGSRGYGPLRAGLSGSVSHGLLMHADVPVVIVPPEIDASWDVGSAIVCGVSEDSSSDDAIRLAGEMAVRLGARLTLLHARTLSPAGVPDVATPPGYYFDARAEVEETTARQVLRDRRPLAGAQDVELAFAVGGAAWNLRATADRERAGLLVVGSRRHGALRSFVSGSVSAHLAAHGPVPVMVVPSEGSSQHVAASYA